ncbi:MAG: hypothetical protein ACM67R_03010 [Clostridiales bacterium]
MTDKTKMKFNVLAIFCILIFSFALTPVTFQNDTYYTIKIGEHIVQTGQIDMQDPFSWHEDLPYTYNHWLYDVSTYLVYNLGENIGIGGFCALYIATIILSMILGIVLYYVSCKLCKNQVVAFLVSMATMYLLKNFIAARAQLVTFILFALTILFIEQFISTKKKRYAIYLIIIPILIANLHCAVWPFYFVLYLPYVVEYMLAVLADVQLYYFIAIKWNELKIKKLTKKGKLDEIGKYQEKIAHLQLDKENGRQLRKKNETKAFKVIFKREDSVKWLMVIMLICTLTGLLTPIGTTPYTLLPKLMQGNTTQNISEHQPLTLINNRAMLIVFTVFLMFLIFTDTKLSLRDFFMLAGLTLLTFMTRRQASMFVIVCGFIFAKMSANFLRKYDKDGTDKVIKIMTSLLGKIFTVLLVILLSFIMYKGKINNEFVNSSSYPVKAADYILEELDINNMRLFNEYNYGSYLLYRGIPVFIDSRADLYAPEFNGKKNADGKYDGRDIFSDYINTSNITKYYEETFEKYKITHVILKTNTKLNMLISRDENYKELYKDNSFVIYERLTK